MTIENKTLRDEIVTVVDPKIFKKRLDHIVAEIIKATQEPVPYGFIFISGQEEEKDKIHITSLSGGDRRVMVHLGCDIFNIYPEILIEIVNKLLGIDKTEELKEVMNVLKQKGI